MRSPVYKSSARQSSSANPIRHIPKATGVKRKHSSGPSSKRDESGQDPVQLTPRSLVG